MDRTQRVAQSPRGERVEKPRSENRKDFLPVTSSICASAAKLHPARVPLHAIPLHRHVASYAIKHCPAAPATLQQRHQHQPQISYNSDVSA